MLAAYSGWEVTAQSENSLAATLDFGKKPELLASFPFPHVLTQAVTLADRKLTIETTVTPTAIGSGTAVFRLSPVLHDSRGAARPMAARPPRRCDISLWTAGESRPVSTSSGTATPKPLVSVTYDDGFDDVPDGAVFTLAGGDRRIDVEFETGYPAAQLFAPGTDDLVAIEPMTAPTDALRRGGYRSAAPGQPATARFSITVT